MKIKHLNYFQVIVFVCFVTGCSVSTGTGSSSYKEDLSAYRIDYSSMMVSDTTSAEPAIPSIDTTTTGSASITMELDALMDSVSSLNKELGYVQGFTIQVYTGKNRDMANDIKNSVYTMIEDSRPQLIYDSPNFKVKVGQFTNRFEAHKTYVALKNTFPAAIIIPEQIKIKD